jgi:hypothetical protein
VVGGLERRLSAMYGEHLIGLLSSCGRTDGAVTRTDQRLRRSVSEKRRIVDVAYKTIDGAKATNRSNRPKSLLDIKRFGGESIW